MQSPLFCFRTISPRGRNANRVREAGPWEHTRPTSQARLSTPSACLGAIQLASAPWSKVSRKLLLPISGMTACLSPVDLIDCLEAFNPQAQFCPLELPTTSFSLCLPKSEDRMQTPLFSSAYPSQLLQILLGGLGRPPPQPCHCLRYMLLFVALLAVGYTRFFSVSFHSEPFRMTILINPL